MVRTIISLDDMDKRWLDRYAERHKQSTAETIRLAIKEFQQKSKAENHQKVLKATFGILKDVLKEDSITIVRKLRAEWDD